MSEGLLRSPPDCTAAGSLNDDDDRQIEGIALLLEERLLFNRSFDSAKALLFVVNDIVFHLKKQVRQRREPMFMRLPTVSRLGFLLLGDF